MAIANPEAKVFQIKKSERVMFCGRTGSGKTTLADRLIRSMDYRTVVFDPKWTWEFPGYKLVTEYDPDPSLKRQVFRPREDADDGWGDSDTFMRAMWYDRQSTVLYIDELTKLAIGRRTLPILADFMRLGRQINKGVWYATQRPKDVPALFFTETEHWFVFDLRWEEDRDKVASFMGPEAEQRPPDEYAFWYGNHKMPNAIYVQQ